MSDYRAYSLIPGADNSFDEILSELTADEILKKAPRQVGNGGGIFG